MKLAILLLTSTCGFVALGARLKSGNTTANSTGVLAPLHDAGEPCTSLTKALPLGLAAGRYCVPRGVESRPAVQTLARGLTWEPGTHKRIDEFYKGLSEAGDLVTAGLFFGDFLPHLSRLAGKEHRVWGFEPNSNNFKAARGTVFLNSLENIWQARVGLGASGGASFDFCVEKNGAPQGGWSHKMDGGPGDTGCVKETAMVVAIDDVVPLARRTSVIHLDVEGQEVACLHGARRTIQKWRPLVIAESNDFASRQKLVSVMSPMGYGPPVSCEDNLFFYP